MKLMIRGKVYCVSKDELNWIASRVFKEEHYGNALTNDELSRRQLLEDEYKDEISMAKLMLENNPSFLDLPFEKKLEVAGNLILQIRDKREIDNGKKM